MVPLAQYHFSKALLEIDQRRTQHISGHIFKSWVYGIIQVVDTAVVPNVDSNSWWTFKDSGELDGANNITRTIHVSNRTE